MSGGHAWYKRYPEDFLNGTLDLTLEEKGAYSICLDLMYSRGGPIPDDPKFISRACGCSVQLWKKLRAKLLSIGKLNVTDDNRLANGRATYEMQRSRAFAAQQSLRGKLGGRPNAEPITATASHLATPPKHEVAGNVQLSSNLVGRNLLLFEARTANINDLAKAGSKASQRLRLLEERKSLLPPPVRSPSPREEEVVVLDAWGKTGLPQPRVMTPDRRKHLAARLTEHGLDGVLQAIEAIRRSKFCHGVNDNGWKADFDFLLQPKSCNRALEGKYADRMPADEPSRVSGPL